MIQSAKIALRGILQERAVNDDVLLTPIVGAEALLNSRPLTHVSVDPNDLEALTPNHFLLLRAHPGCNLDFPPGQQLSSRKRHQHAQELITHFWNRWLREYVPNLIERRKWLQNRRNLAVNDLVLVISPNTPRGSWPIGRVVNVHLRPTSRLTPYNSFVLKIPSQLRTFSTGWQPAPFLFLFRKSMQLKSQIVAKPGIQNFLVCSNKLLWLSNSNRCKLILLGPHTIIKQ